MCVCQCREDSSGCASRSSHAAAYHSDQGQIGLKLDGIRLYRAVQSCDDLLLFFRKLILMDEYGHGINTGRHMFKGKIIIFKDTEHFSAKADLGIHHALLYGDRSETFLSCNTGDGEFRFAAGILYDHGSRILRCVGVQHMDRNALLAEREDGVLMKHGSSHVGKLTQLAVGNGGNDFRIFDDTRIGYQETGNVGPVLVDISVYGLCHDGTGDVRTAAGEGFYASVRFCAVESRNDCVIQIF